MADWFKLSLAVQPQQQKDGAGDGETSPTNHVDPLPFNSRRSPVLCRHACVATSQPLASAIGYDLLKRGANAADTAIAVAAALAVTEPCSTGLGGDMFCLYHDAKTRQVSCVNGSGRSPQQLTGEVLRERYPNEQGDGISVEKFRLSPHAVTTPGAAAGWQDTLERHGSGKFSFAELLEPAALLAEEGFPVAPITSHHWQAGLECVKQWPGQDGSDGRPIPLTTNGTDGPEAGDLIRNPDMARVLRDLGQHGATYGFYQGATGQAIVARLQELGGCMTQDDMNAHSSCFPDAVSAVYRGKRLWQVPPNGQGVAGLVALTGLAHLEEQGIIAPLGPVDSTSSSCAVGGTDAMHALMEMMRLGFADARDQVSCPDHTQVDDAWYTDMKRIGPRAAKLFDPQHATIAGTPSASSCTVSFQVVDCDGNAISFVNSNFMGFGTGIVPAGCGFTLQNRAMGFSLDKQRPDGTPHPNAVGPSKRPYHTIIPGMLTHDDTGELYATISNMGGNMQPQGHLQLTVNMAAGELDPQVAIDQPRFCIVDGTHGGAVHLERGVPEQVVQQLRDRGHIILSDVQGHNRAIFGRAQIIQRNRRTGVLWAGSDGRADGCAMGF